MSRSTFGSHAKTVLDRKPPGRGHERGAARWLALAVLAAAAAGFTASPARADSAVTVTTTSDENVADGTCSLREAILYAESLNGANTDCGTKATGTTTINVPAGHYTFPPTWVDAHLKIGPGGPGPIVIAGAGASTTGTVIDGQGNLGRLLLVNPGAIVTIKNLTLQGGKGFAEDGGGIANLGTLTLDHVVVADNRTQSLAGAGPGEDRGGGILNTGTLTLLSSVVSGNSTGRGWDSLPVTGCLASGNAGYPGADGGGLYNQGGSVTAVYTTFVGNATGRGGDGSAGADARSVGQPCADGGGGGGGGHGGEGGAIFNNDGTVTLSGSAIYDNITGTGGSGGPGGFGAHSGGDGGDGGWGGAGGGIFNNGMLTVVNTTIYGNGTGNGAVGGTGGGSDTASFVGVNGLGGAGGPGGGIYQQDGQASVQESTVSLNAGGLGAGADGVYVGPGVGGIEVQAGELTEIDTIVSKNGCLALPGGQIKDGLAAGDGHLNLTFPTASCPGIVADPLLGPLQENGGPTRTMAIAPPSPAVDRVPATAAAGCTPIDQRGIIRPQPAGGRCDIGAYEFKP